MMIITWNLRVHGTPLSTPMQTTFRLFAMLVLLAVAAFWGCDSQSPVGEEHADAVAGDVADLDALADTDSEGDDVDSTTPDDVTMPDDAIASDIDGHSELDLEPDTEQTTPIADGWCWLAGPSDARQVVCEDGALVALPASCAIYDGEYVRFDERIDLYVFAALGCTTIEHDLGIVLGERLPVLTGLELLETVGGSLNIGDNDESPAPNGGSIEGLDALKHVGGDMSVITDSLVSLVGLETLGTVGGHLTIEENASLASLRGLDGLRDVDRTVRIVDNPQLESLDGLGALEHIGWDLVLSLTGPNASLHGLTSLHDVDGELSLSGAMRTLEGLEALKEVGSLFVVLMSELRSLDGLQLERFSLDADYVVEWWEQPLEGPRLVIVANDDLTDLIALRSLEPTVLDLLNIEDNASLDTLDGLEQIVAANTIHIYHSPALTTLAGLDGLTSAHSVVIESNPLLTTLLQGDGLTSTDIDITVENNPALTSLGTLAGPGSTFWDVTLAGNALTDLSGLEQLDRADHIVIQDEPALTSLDGLGHDDTTVRELQMHGLTALSQGTSASIDIEGTLHVDGSPQLTSLGALQAVDRISDVRLVDLPAFTDLSLMSRVVKMYSSGSLELHNTGVTDLDALSGFEETWGALRLTDNAQLQDMTGLSALHHVHLGLTVTDNPQLPQCQAEALAANLWVNGVTISGNDTTATCP